MTNLPIPIEYCQIVNAFNQTNTLRAAAALLGVDAGGLVRKAQIIANEYGYLQKVGNRWAVTDAGRRVAYWVDQLIHEQTALLEQKPRLRVASFAWFAEEILIPNFSELNTKFERKYAWSCKTIAADLEAELLHGRSDFVITGHAPNDPSIAHKKVSSYSWVVIAPVGWKKSLGGDVVGILKTKNFIRHSGMNPEQVLGFKPENILDLMVDGVIGLRSAVAAGLGWSLVPAMSVQTLLAERKIIKLSVPTHIKDDVSLWWLRGRKDLAPATKALTTWLSEIKIL